MNNKYQYVIENGMVKKGRFVVSGAVPLSDFLSKIEDLTPSDVDTPVLPTNCVKYRRFADQRMGVDRSFAVFVPAGIKTISFHPSGSAAEQYNISMPPLVFKFEFDRGGRIMYIKLVTVKQRPTRGTDRVYRMKLPNLNYDSVCMSAISIPGEYAESCEKTIDAYFGQQSFNHDWEQYPNGIRNFEDWQAKTEANPRFIEDCEFDYISTLDEWMNEA